MNVRFFQAISVFLAKIVRYETGLFIYRRKSLITSKLSILVNCFKTESRLPPMKEARINFYERYAFRGLDREACLNLFIAFSFI